MPKTAALGEKKIQQIDDRKLLEWLNFWGSCNALKTVKKSKIYVFEKLDQIGQQVCFNISNLDGPTFQIHKAFNDLYNLCNSSFLIELGCSGTIMVIVKHSSQIDYWWCERSLRGLFVALWEAVEGGQPWHLPVKLFGLLRCK